MGVFSCVVTRETRTGPQRRQRDAYLALVIAHDRRWKAAWRSLLPSHGATEAGHRATEEVGPAPTWEDVPLWWFAMGPNRDPDNPHPGRTPRRGQIGSRAQPAPRMDPSAVLIDAIQPFHQADRRRTTYGGQGLCSGVVHARTGTRPRAVYQLARRTQRIALCAACAARYRSVA